MKYNGFDLSILEVLHINYASPFLDQVMLAISSDIYFISLAIIIGIAFYRGFGQRFWKYYLFLLASVGLSDATAAHILKPFFGRLRPCQVIEEIRIVSGCAGLYSFPSNHATNAMCISVFVFAMGFRKLGWTLMALSTLVGISRVYLGVHYPTDVLVGFVLGTLIALMGARVTFRYLGRSNFPVDIEK